MSWAACVGLLIRVETFKNCHGTGNHIVLGLERILKKAIEKGVVSPNAQLSDSEVYNLIFEPGFSTAA
jgi:hypothetical protein